MQLTIIGIVTGRSKTSNETNYFSSSVISKVIILLLLRIMRNMHVIFEVMSPTLVKTDLHLSSEVSQEPVGFSLKF